MVAVDEPLDVQEMLDEAAWRSRTAKLWVQYIKLVGRLKLVIFCTRTGNLQLTRIAEMITVFNAAGHLVYAKCTCLYLQQMGKRKQVMHEAEFKMFAEKGMFVAID